jgi:hypothetical protein
MAAGAEGDSHLPTSHVGREQVLDSLKAAFVQGRLAKDEFDLRVARCSRPTRNWMLSPPTSPPG